MVLITGGAGFIGSHFADMYRDGTMSDPGPSIPNPLTAGNIYAKVGQKEEAVILLHGLLRP